MRTKKAAADLIAYVLLIGFTIALAAFVTNWVIDQTKKFNPEDVVGGSKVYCEDVVLGIEEIIQTSSGSDNLCQDKFVGTITLKNKGKFTIYNVKILGEGASIDSLPNPTNGLKPGEVATIGTGFCKEPGINIEIIPQIEVEEEKFYCAESAAVINDDVLALVQPPAP